MNSTPPSPASTMRLTALQPPPPTPTTLIFAPVRFSWSSVSLSTSSRISASIRSTSEELFENAPEPPGHTAERSCTAAPCVWRAIAMRIQRQPDRCSKRRTVHVVGHAAYTHGTAPPDRQVENLLRDFRHAFENR